MKSIKTEKEKTESEVSVQFKNNLLEGSITRNILTLALPIMFANFIANAYFVIDMIFVGRLGASALAAVSLGGVLMSFIWTLMLGLTISTASLIARFYGAKNAHMVSSVTIQSLFIAFVISAFLAIFGFTGVEFTLRLLGARDEVLSLGMTYSKIVFCGSVSLIILFVVNSIFRGSGDVKMPMLTLGISSVINIVLDPLLIFGLGPFPELGVKGAAIATITGQSIGALLNLIILYRGYSRIKIKEWSMKPDMKLLKTQIAIGIPGSLQNLFYSISGFIIMHLAAAYGTFAVDAYGIGLRLDIMIMLPGWALGASVATILGQNLGARQPERAEKTAWCGSKIYFSILIVTCTALWFGAENVISLFIHDSQIMATGASYIRIIVFGYIFLSLSLILQMSMNGAGYTFAPMVIVAVSVLGFRIPAALFFSETLALNTAGLWYAISGSFILQAALSAIWFARGTWKHKKVT